MLANENCREVVEGLQSEKCLPKLENLTLSHFISTHQFPALVSITHFERPHLFDEKILSVLKCIV